MGHFSRKILLTPSQATAHALLPGSAPDAPRRRNRRSACQSLTTPRPPLPPPLPCASQRGVEEAAAHDQQFDQDPAGATSIRHRDSNQHWRSTALPLRAVEHASPSRTSAAQPARQAPLNPGLSRWLLPLVPHRTPHRFATTNTSCETNATRTTNAPGAAAFGRVYDAVVAPASP